MNYQLGLTPLMHAVMANDEGCVRVILRFNPDQTLRNSVRDLKIFLLNFFVRPDIQHMISLAQIR